MPKYRELSFEYQLGGVLLSLLPLSHLPVRPHSLDRSYTSGRLRLLPHRLILQMARLLQTASTNLLALAQCPCLKPLNFLRPAQSSSFLHTFQTSRSLALPTSSPTLSSKSPRTHGFPHLGTSFLTRSRVSPSVNFLSTVSTMEKRMSLFI